MKEVIGTSDLHLFYGEEDTKVHALRGIDLSLGRGDLTALVGPSGSGKSSLLHILGAMLTPTSGQVRIMGEAIESYNRKQLAQIRRKHIGFVFQNFALVTHLTALENVMLPLYPVNPQGLRKHAKELLDRVGLNHRYKHTPNHLSGGERQRVAIARSLINEPDLVLGDEITGNLDSTTGNAIFELVRDLNESDELTVVLVTHDTSIADLCRKRIQMLDGKLEI